MSLPLPQFRPPALPEPTPIVRVVAREDVMWDRPIFRAPLLEVLPVPLPGWNLASELSPLGAFQR
jgi:hypothetical protein